MTLAKVVVSSFNAGDKTSPTAWIGELSLDTVTNLSSTQCRPKSNKDSLIAADIYSAIVREEVMAACGLQASTYVD
jgi:hypothetical protein